MSIEVVGIDLVKNFFQIWGLDIGYWKAVRILLCSRHTLYSYHQIPGERPCGYKTVQ